MLDPNCCRAVTIALCTRCPRCYNTAVIPFRLSFEPGISLYEQVVYAAKKAIVSGRMRPGDAFPSVREMSKVLKINPNTAHKVVTQMVAEGLLEVHPGIGTVVASQAAASAADTTKLLNRELEQLVVEAKKLGLELDELTAAMALHWRRLDGRKG
jgi:GntR family transcriptional regulator